MNKPKNRVTLDDSFMSVVMKLAEGNPGAISVIMQLFEKSAKIDPQDFMGNLGTILSLDTHGIYGSKIWMLYKDVCKEDIKLVVAMLRGVQLGIIRESTLIHAIDNYGSGVDVDDTLAKVKKELVDFDVELATQ
jgi:hypothetical protein